MNIQYPEIQPQYEFDDFSISLNYKFMNNIFGVNFIVVDLRKELLKFTSIMIPMILVLNSGTDGHFQVEKSRIKRSRNSAYISSII